MFYGQLYQRTSKNFDKEFVFLKIIVLKQKEIMKRIVGLLVGGFFIVSAISAQNEKRNSEGDVNLSVQVPKPFVFSINQDKVYADEFERQFLKNINLKEDPITSKDIRSYLDLYIKFKLKVQDAKDAGLDTASAYVQELQMYRDQLARNYLLLALIQKD